MPSRANTSSTTLKARAEPRWSELDFLAAADRRHDLHRSPISSASRCASIRNLGHYTNFVNFFGLSGLGLAVRLPARRPAVRHHLDRPRIARPASCSNSARAGSAPSALPLGKTASTLPPPRPIPTAAEHRVSIAVVGAHMSGLPLNGQLTELRRPAGKCDAGRRRIYRLYALPGGPPQRPGLLRVAPGRRARSSSRSGACPRGGSAHFVAGSRRRSASARSRWKTVRRCRASSARATRQPARATSPPSAAGAPT